MATLERQRLGHEKEQELAAQALHNRLALHTIEQEHRLGDEEKGFRALKAQEEENYRMLNLQTEKEIAQERTRQEIANSISSNDLTRRLVETLPELARNMPPISELKSLQISGDNSAPFATLGAYLARLLEIGRSLGLEVPGAARAGQQKSPCQSVQDS